MAVQGIPSDKIIPQGEFAEPGKEPKKGRCWNYRIISSDDIAYYIHKVFYEDGKIDTYSLHPSIIDGYEVGTRTDKDINVRFERVGMAFKAEILQREELEKLWKK